MANYFAPLAAPQIRNALIDTSSINNALDGWREQGNVDRQFGMQQKQMDAQTAERTYQHGRDAKQDSMLAVQTFGKQATAVDQMQDPAQRAAAWKSIIARHGANGLTPEEMDPITGPKLMAAQAGQWLDPRDSQLKDLEMQKTRAEIGRLRQSEDPTALRLRQLQGAGVDANSPEGRAFLLTGQYSPKPVYSPAETAVDKNYAKSYEEDIANGGLTDAEKNISQLRSVRDQLTNKDGPNLTGPIVGRIPDAINSLPFMNPEAVNAREQVEEVVQRNLRLVLGAQFTQNEGFALIKRAFNPALDEKTNAARLNRLLSTMEQALQAKKDAAQYYEQHGTLRGFKGKINYTISDFDNALDGGGTGGDASGGNGAGDWRSTFKRVD